MRMVILHYVSKKDLKRTINNTTINKVNFSSNCYITLPKCKAQSLVITNIPKETLRSFVLFTKPLIIKIFCNSKTFYNIILSCVVNRTSMVTTTQKYRTLIITKIHLCLEHRQHLNLLFQLNEIEQKRTYVAVRVVRSF